MNPFHRRTLWFFVAILLIELVVIVGAGMILAGDAKAAVTAQDCRLVMQATRGPIGVKRAAARGCAKVRADQALERSFAACGRRPGYAAQNACTIRIVFGPVYGDAAVHVAKCESTFNPGAVNGDYQGMFQVSSTWRRIIPGWGWTPRAQAQHAWGVFNHRDVHRSWSPTWDCAP